MKSQKVPPLQIVRVFDAPRAEVFQWWAEAERLQQWSGCNQCISCKVVMDFRVGGGFRQTMKIAVDDGVCDFVLTATYTEIITPKRIRYLVDMGQQNARVHIDFIEEGAHTKVILTQDGFATPESCQIVAEGTNASLDQLSNLLKSPSGCQTDYERN